MERNDVEQLVSRLLEILNNPEKHLLLNQIRYVLINKIRALKYI